MLPGFFLDMAENTGDNFSYVILPVEKYSAIPLDTRPVTVVCSVVRRHDIDSDHVPLCIRDTKGFKFMNQKGDELIGDTESFPVSDTNVSDPDTSISEEIASSILINLKTRLQSPTLETFDPIVISPAEKNLVPMEVTPSNLPMPTNAPISSNNVPNIISQTQDYADDISIGSTGNDITADPFGREHDLFASQLNSSLDEKDDYVLAELAAITSHRTVSGVLELEVEYNNGEHSL